MEWAAVLTGGVCGCTCNDSGDVGVIVSGAADAAETDAVSVLAELLSVVRPEEVSSTKGAATLGESVAGARFRGRTQGATGRAVSVSGRRAEPDGARWRPRGWGELVAASAVGRFPDRLGRWLGITLSLVGCRVVRGSMMVVGGVTALPGFSAAASISVGRAVSVRSMVWSGSAAGVPVTVGNVASDRRAATGGVATVSSERVVLL